MTDHLEIRNERLGSTPRFFNVMVTNGTQRATVEIEYSEGFDEGPTISFTLTRHEAATLAAMLLNAAANLRTETHGSDDKAYAFGPTHPSLSATDALIELGYDEGVPER